MLISFQDSGEKFRATMMMSTGVFVFHAVEQRGDKGGNKSRSSSYSSGRENGVSCGCEESSDEFLCRNMIPKQSATIIHPIACDCIVVFSRQDLEIFRSERYMMPGLHLRRIYFYCTPCTKTLLKRRVTSLRINPPPPPPPLPLTCTSVAPAPKFIKGGNR